MSLSAVTAWLMLTLAALTLQVNITLSGLVPSDQTTQRCPNIPPGACCRSLGLFYGSELVHFTGLQTLDIAFAWDQHIPINTLNNPFSAIRGCSGIPAAYGRGPGIWQLYTHNPEYIMQEMFTFGIHGASYIIGPESLPRDLTQSRMNAIQGIHALVAGGGTWLPSTGSGSSLNPRAAVKRKIATNLIGTAYVGQPPSWIWPSVVTVKGIEYMADEMGNLVFKSSNGQVLDLTHLSH